MSVALPATIAHLYQYSCFVNQQFVRFSRRVSTFDVTCLRLLSQTAAGIFHLKTRVDTHTRYIESAAFKGRMSRTQLFAPPTLCHFYFRPFSMRNSCCCRLSVSFKTGSFGKCRKEEEEEGESGNGEARARTPMCVCLAASAGRRKEKRAAVAG